MRRAKGKRAGRRGAVRSRVMRLRRRAAGRIRDVRRVVMATAIPIAMTVSQNLAARLDRTPRCEGPSSSASSAPAGSRELMADPPGQPRFSLTLASGTVVVGQMVVVRVAVCGPVEEQPMPEVVTIGLESVGSLGSMRMIATWRRVSGLRESR